MAYAILAGVSGTLFLLSLIFGGITDGIGDFFDFDTDTDGPAGLSLSTLLAAFTAVGVVGLVSSMSGLAWWGSLIVALLCGLVVGFLIQQFVSKVLVKSQHNQQITRESYVGRTATVNVTVSPTRAGEVRFIDANGASVTQSAVVTDGMTYVTGASVVITAVSPGNVTISSI